MIHIIFVAELSYISPIKNTSSPILTHFFLSLLIIYLSFSFSSNRWVNAPPCRDCGNDTVAQGMTAPLPSETLYGASRVEQYRYVVEYML